MKVKNDNRSKFSKKLSMLPMCGFIARVTGSNPVEALAPVVRRLDNAIHRRNRYPVDKYQQKAKKTNHAIHWIVIYPVDSGVNLANDPGLIFSGFFFPIA